MTIYDWDRDSIPSARVYDAEGKEIFRILRCDTETGMVERIEINPFDEVLNIQSHVKEFRPAPLKVDFLK